MKILNFGSCNVDHVYSLDHIVVGGETETTEKLELCPGGKGLNQSIAVAKAGAEIYHAGCIGEDGELLRDILLENRVNVSYLKKVDGKNGHAIIQVSAKGENSIFIYPGSNEKVAKPFIDSVLAHFGKDDILLLQNEISNVDYIVEKAHEKGLCIMLNPSPIDEQISRIDFKKLSYIILNEVEAAALSGCESPEESLVYFKREYPDLKVVLTLGSKGSIFMNHSGVYEQAAFAVSCAQVPGVCFFYDYASMYLLENTDMKRKIMACEPMCRKIWFEEPDKREFLHTLSVYLDMERATTLAAERLFIHRNTINYRIKYIKEYTDWDYEDAALRDYLRLSIYFLARWERS